MLLFDAPFSWCLGAIEELERDGLTPQAMFLSHGDLAAAGDAFSELSYRLGLDFILHEADQQSDAARDSGQNFCGVPDPHLCREVGLEIIEIPGHAPGSIMLYLPTDRVLLTGDAAVGPGPRQVGTGPRLQRPKMAESVEPRFIDIWKDTASRCPIDMILPLHGQGYSRNSLGSEFDRVLTGIWIEPPMDPSR